MSSFGRILGTIALMLAGAAGLVMSLCGGAFTLAAFSTSEMIGALVISVPSLLLGLGLLWLAVRKLRGRLGGSPGQGS
jgi:hypothetical protein